MTGPDAIAAIHRLGLSQARFARLAGIHPNAVSRWATKGIHPVGPAVSLLILLEARPELIPVLERAKGLKAA